MSGSQPRFRSEGSDWAESDFADDLSGEHVSLGALSNTGPVDEEAAFAARPRRQARRPARGAPPAARPAPARRRSAPRPTPPSPSTPRDLPTAIMTGLAVAVVAIICFTQGTGATAVLAALIIGVATLEFSNTLHKRGLRPATIVALVACTFMPIAARHVRRRTRIPCSSRSS